MHSTTGPVVGPTHHRKGFTLIELMIVVGIIALAFGYSSSVVYRSMQKTDTKEVLYDMKRILEKSRELSIVAGARLGLDRNLVGGLPPQPRISDFSGNCSAGLGQGLLEINITGAQVTHPMFMVPDLGALDVTCAVYDVTTAGNSNWQFDAATTVGTFSFGPTGALASGPPGGAYIQLSNPNTQDVFGLHVFPSGVICAASAPGLCLEDVGL